MKILKPIRLRWWQASLFKISTISLGIIIGLSFTEYLIDYVNIFVFLFIIPAVYLIYWWWKQ